MEGAREGQSNGKESDGTGVEWSGGSGEEAREVDEREGDRK